MSGVATTSTSTTFSTTPLTDTEKTDIRRFCGYEAYGNGAVGFESWRFFTAYGVMEFKLSNLSTAELQVIRQYLANLYTLENAVPGATANLDTDQASVWKHNPNEVRDRMRLFRTWRMQLCGFLGVPPGKALQNEGSCQIVI